MIELNSLVSGCVACRLRSNCEQVVCGSGNEKATLMIVGEFPKPEDELMGEPFKCRDGVLLRKLLLLAEISEDQVYFTYMVKCLPLKGERPKKIESDICKGWLWKEIKQLKPKIILTLGELPTKILRKKTLCDAIWKFESVSYTDALITSWFHPSFLLTRSKKLEEETVEFFKTIKDKINV